MKNNPVTVKPEYIKKTGPSPIVSESHPKDFAVTKEPAQLDVTTMPTTIFLKLGWKSSPSINQPTGPKPIEYIRKKIIKDVKGSQWMLSTDFASFACIVKKTPNARVQAAKTHEVEKSIHFLPVLSTTEADIQAANHCTIPIITVHNFGSIANSVF